MTSTRLRRATLMTCALAVLCLVLVAAVGWVIQQQPDARLQLTASEPDTSVRDSITSVPWLHIDRSTLQGHAAFHGVEPWVATSFEGSRCLIAYQRVTDVILAGDCVPPGVEAVVDVGPGRADDAIEDLVPGDVVRFTFHGDTVDAVVHRFPEAAKVRSPTSVTNASGWIAYESESSERRDDGIFLVRPDGSRDHEILLEVPGRRLHPDFSPDGTMLAFDQSEGGVDQVYVAAADGTGARLVAECDPANCLQMWEPSWSPDGTRLAISTAVPGDPWIMGIGILDVATGALTPVVEHPVEDGQDHSARWSPDGRHLVFWRGEAGDEGDAAIFIVGVDGAGLKQLTDTDLVAGDPDFSPDGSRIVFTTHPLLQYATTGQSEIYTMAVDGSDQTRITAYGKTGPRATQPRWTPDGTAIIYTRTTQSGQPRTIYAMNADGSDDGPVVTEKRIYTHAVLQPAG